MGVFARYSFLTTMVFSRLSALYQLIYLFLALSICNAFPRSNQLRTGRCQISSFGCINPPPPTILFSSAGDNDTQGKTSSNDLPTVTPQDNNPAVKFWADLSMESKEDIKSTILSFAFAFAVRILLLEPRYIPSLSMFPTFDIGDQLLVDKVTHFVRGYHRRDVVVFNPSQTYIELSGNTEALIKRVVAVEGDTVEVKNRKLVGFLIFSF